MSDFETPGESSGYVKPPDWKRRDEEWEKQPIIAMPAWARTFARTKYLAPEEERRSNDSDQTPSEQADLEKLRSYEKHWRSVVREMDQLKAHAAKDWIAAPKDSALRSALAQRMFDLTEELDRLHVEHRKGAPIVLRYFALVDPSLAGRNVDRVERDRSREPLFNAMKSAGLVDDPVDNLPMGGF